MPLKLINYEVLNPDVKKAMTVFVVQRGYWYNIPDKDAQGNLILAWDDSLLNTENGVLPLDDLTTAYLQGDWESGASAEECVKCLHALRAKHPNARLSMYARPEKASVWLGGTPDCDTLKTHDAAYKSSVLDIPVIEASDCCSVEGYDHGNTDPVPMVEYLLHRARNCAYDPKNPREIVLEMGPLHMDDGDLFMTPVSEERTKAVVKAALRLKIWGVVIFTSFLDWTGNSLNYAQHRAILEASANALGLTLDQYKTMLLTRFMQWIREAEAEYLAAST